MKMKITNVKTWKILGRLVGTKKYSEPAKGKSAIAQRRSRIYHKVPTVLLITVLDCSTRDDSVGEATSNVKVMMSSTLINSSPVLGFPKFVLFLTGNNVSSCIITFFTFENKFGSISFFDLRFAH